MAAVSPATGKWGLWGALDLSGAVKGLRRQRKCLAVVVSGEIVSTPQLAWCNSCHDMKLYLRGAMIILSGYV